MGGNMYQKMAVTLPYFAGEASPTPRTEAVLMSPVIRRDMYMFKVPSLRNVALTAPYFHDGSAATLEDAVRTIGKYQLRPATERAARGIDRGIP